MTGQISEGGQAAHATGTAGDDHVTRAEDSNPAGRKWWLHALVLLGFLVVGLTHTRPMLHDPLHQTIDGGNRDPAIFLFFLSNTSHALVHGHLKAVLVTHMLNAPAGVNALWNTSLLLPGIVLTPVTALAGPVLSLNLLIVLGPVLSAWSAYLCSGRFLTRTSARIATGLVFGFSPALMAANLGHFHLTLLMFVPPILLLAVDAATGRRSPALCGVLIGVGVTCQVLIGEEVLALTGVTVGTLLVVLAAQRWRLIQQRLRPFLLTAATTGLTTLVVAGPFLAVQFFGPQKVSQAVSAPDTYVLDPASLLLPNTVVRFKHNGLTHLLTTSPLNGSESMGYLGWPLLVLITVLVVVRRRDVVVRTTAIMAVLLATYALGFTLHLDGHRTGIPMPWKLTDGLPLLGNLLPVRWMLVVDLMMALLVGLAIDSVRSERASRLGQLAVLGVVALSLLPLYPVLASRASPTNTPSWFTTAGPHVTGSVLVVPTPHPRDARAMTWSAVAGTKFPIVGGYFIGPSKDGRGGFYPYPVRPIAHLLDLIAVTGSTVKATPDMRLAARADFTYWNTHTVVLAACNREDQYRVFLSTLLGRAPERSGGVWVWTNIDPASL